MSELRSGTTLQNGKYRILSTLGQGGFGITYLAIDTYLDKQFAIKEFFYKDCCERNPSTRHITVPTSANREMVQRFKQKFLKEARTIYKLHHPNIVGLREVFEENDTAYYVMDYIEGESLSQLVKRRGAIPEHEALAYIRDAAEALKYVHSRQINHLDVKPANLIKRHADGKVLLIDFGVAKQYDAESMQGTSTTPVCISAGYSPMEQYLKKGVQSFSPQSDVYALAATLYKLLTGITPPEAGDVQDDGLPVDALLAKKVSEPVCLAIAKAMKGRKERTQSIELFLENLGNTAEETRQAEQEQEPEPQPQPKEEPKWEAKPVQNEAKSKFKTWIFAGIAAAVLACAAIIFFSTRSSGGSETTEDTAEVVTSPTDIGTLYTIGDVAFEMVNVEGGTFTMGATAEQGSDAEDDEKPAHQVTLSSYMIGKTEVTQALWEAVMGKSVSQIASENGWETYGVGSNYPMYDISWDDCQTFIRKLNALTGKNFRLPTEAEWEFAARGGNNSRGYKYSGSNTLSNVAWYDDTSDGTTHPVGSKSPNELGIYDMSGNVWEWCSDWFGDYSSSSQSNPTGPNGGSIRVDRGGGWNGNAGGCRVSFRYGSTPSRRNYYHGLRLAL
ncbi:MAG: SUMF1/EgtB/PvdO family nonheme iron enzyme [Sodaliphilus sp.]